MKAKGDASTNPYVELMLDDREEPRALPETVYAQSAISMPILNAWWVALEVASLTELRTTVVRPGELAPLWRKNGGLDVITAEYLIAVFVSEVLIDGLKSDRYGIALPGILTACADLTGALLDGGTDTGTEPEFEAVPHASEPLRDVFRARSERKLMLLERVGLITREKGRWIVPAALRGPVGQGLATAITILSEHSAL